VRAEEVVNHGVEMARGERERPACSRVVQRGVAFHVAHRYSDVPSREKQGSTQKHSIARRAFAFRVVTVASPVFFATLSVYAVFAAYKVLKVVNAAFSVCSALCCFGYGDGDRRPAELIRRRHEGGCCCIC